MKKKRNDRRRPRFVPKPFRTMLTVKAGNITHREEIMGQIPRHDSEKEVLDVYGAAQLLGLSEKTVRRLAAENQLPAKRLGRQWRFLRRRLLETCRGQGK